MLGNIVHNVNPLPLVEGVNRININSEKLSKGVYILRLEKEGKQYQVKFTK